MRAGRPLSRGTVLRAYDFANRDEAAAAAREGRKPSRPASKWSNESRAAKRKSRGAWLQLEPVAPAGACAAGLLNHWPALTSRSMGMPPIRLLGPPHLGCIQSLATGWWQTAPSRG